MIEDNYWYDRYLSVCDNNDRLTAQLRKTEQTLEDTKRSLAEANEDRNKMGSLWASAIKNCVELEDRLVEIKQQLAERDGEIERCICEYNKLKGDAELLKSQLTAAKDAISIYEDGLKALQPEAVMEAEGKYLDKIGVLQQDNRNLRAEVERLTDAAIKMDDNFNNLSKMYDEVVEKRKTFGAWVTPREAIADARKQAAQEIVEMLTVIIPDGLQCVACCRAAIKSKFGL